MKRKFTINVSEESDKSLEEAAKEYADGPECSWVGITALEDAFIAGAEWMAGQIDNESYEEKAEELYRDEYGIHCVVSVGTDYKPGDGLLVYTRKK